MRNVVAHEYFYLLFEVRQKLLNAFYGPDDLVTINIDTADLIKIYIHLGDLKEKDSSAINEDMKYTLLPQLMALVNGDDPNFAAGAGEVLMQIQALSTEYTGNLNNSIEQGREWLKIAGDLQP